MGYLLVRVLSGDPVTRRPRALAVVSTPARICHTYGANVKQDAGPPAPPCSGQPGLGTSERGFAPLPKPPRE